MASPGPQVQQLYVDPVTRKFLQEYHNDREKFLFPNLSIDVQVDTPTGKYPIISRDYQRFEDLTWAFGAQPSRLGWSQTYGSWSLVRYGDMFVDDKDRLAISEAQTSPVNISKKVAEYLGEAMWVHKENLLAGIMQDTAQLTNNKVYTLANERWDNPASDPVKQRMQAEGSLRPLGSPKPNSMAVSDKVYRELPTNENIRDGLRFTMQGLRDLPGDADFARIFKVKNFYVGDVTEVTSASGQSSTTTAELWGPHYWLFYKPEGGSAALGDTSALTTFRLQDDMQVTTEDVPLSNEKAWIMKSYFQIKLTDVNSIWFGKNVVTP